ncbi:hypothetical protein VI817_005305 [Penicillium citrinum]|nr:hypothetical protein VI817_005305 [Penicillium citrinum]
MRDQVFAAYIDGYFPTQMDVSGVDLWRYLVQGFLRLPYKSEMLDKTLSSISCLYLGKVYHDTHMFKYGLQLYNGAIRLMSNMISRDNFNEDIVYTAVIFQEIEV